MTTSCVFISTYLLALDMLRGEGFVISPYRVFFRIITLITPNVTVYVLVVDLIASKKAAEALVSFLRT